ncbi:MAG: anhydro-N-acetylmuramic acid kinase [Rickettsiaceae bacterium]|nr:MAG: anhydro-N-acetylmuramic acid kinase [Rickettsiaceae bacterium]
MYMLKKIDQRFSKSNILAIGLMSGTSLDGIDAALIETDGNEYFRPIESLYYPYGAQFQDKLRQISATNQQNWLYVEKELTILHAQCVNSLIDKTGTTSDQIDIIGFHGQTIYHNAEQGISWQIGNPHLLAALTKINVVSDFRRRDVAAGGQGAPLVPIFHKCLLQKEVIPLAIINVGGVANITFIYKDDLLAFDTGPGNGLIDDAMNKYFDKSFDQDGSIAASGNIDYSMIDSMLEHDFFKQLPPKSLDRGNFNVFLALCQNLKSEDIVATLTHLTVLSIISGIKLLPVMPQKLFFCGGGSKNISIMNGIKKEIAKFKSTADNQPETVIEDFKYFGDVDFVEAQAFGYLAVRYLKNLASSFSMTTGVNQETLSGVLFHL